MPVPGPGYAITARVEVPASASAAGDLTVAVGRVGGVVTAFLGGSHIDLRQATIPRGEEATLDIFAMMGGCEIIVVKVPAP